MNDEVFLCISNCYGFSAFTNWEINEAGVLRVKSTKREITGSKDTNGYAIVSLSQNGLSKSISFHRLYAELWIYNPLNLPDVDHIDGNKLNNSPLNLRWCSKSQNCRNRRSGRSSSGIQNVSRCRSGRYLYWRTAFKKDDGSVYTELHKRFSHEEKVPDKLIDRRNELCFKFHGEFSLKLARS
jgi:hypothetical protein